MTEYGVAHRQVEEGVGNRHLQEIILTANNFARRPGEADVALTRSFILPFFDAFCKSDGLADAGAQLVERSLVVLVLGRRLSREPGGRGFHIVTGALDLIDERLHVWREPA